MQYGQPYLYFSWECEYSRHQGSEHEEEQTEELKFNILTWNTFISQFVFDTAGTVVSRIDVTVGYITYITIIQCCQYRCHKDV